MMNNIIGPYRYNDELYYRSSDGKWFSMAHDSLQVSLEEASGGRYQSTERERFQNEQRGIHVTKVETITIRGQEWLPIKVEDIARADYPPVSQQCSTSFFEPVKAIRIELKSGSVRWTNGCRRWWGEKEEELLVTAHELENRARDLRREASRYG